MALIDQWGNPIDLAKLREEQATPTVSGVRQPSGPRSSDGLTPQGLARMLRDAERGHPMQYLALAEEMEEKFPHYLSVLGTRKRAVCQLEITVDPAGEDQQAIDDAELIKSVIDRDTIQEELFDILDAVGKGFSLAEIIWDVSERQWVPERLERVDPQWLHLDREDLRTLSLKSADGGIPEPLTPFKFITTEIKAKSGLPIRSGLARPAAWAFLFHNFDVKAWVQFAEVYGQPLRVGRFHPGATDDDKRTLLRAVANIGTDAAAIIPNGMQIEFVKTDQKASGDLYEALAKMMEQQVSKLVLGQTTTTDAISGGHAVAKEHNEVREDIERADAKQVAAVLNRDLVRPTIDLNHGPRKAYPRLRIGRAEQVDSEKFVSIADKAARLGVQLSKKHFYQSSGLQPPDGPDDTLQVAPQPPAAGTQQQTASRQQPPPADAIQQFTDEDLRDELGDLLDPTTASIEDIMQAAGTYEDLVKALTAKLDTVGVDEIAQHVARMRFQARLAGEVGADIGNGEDNG